MSVVTFCLWFGLGLGMQGEVKDPAPPQVQKLSPQESSEAQAYPELKQFAQPGPLAQDAMIEDWPGFLGPRRDGVSGEGPLKRSWGQEGPALLWTMERQFGHGSPAVVGDRLVFMHRSETEVFIDCLQPGTGLRHWRLSYPTDYRAQYSSFIGTRTTPLIVADRVFVHGPGGVFHCLDLATGRVHWRRNLREEFDLYDTFFGIACSPLHWEGQIIVNLGAKNGPSVAAFDAASGALIWGVGEQWGPSCASPVIGEVAGKERVFVLGAGATRPPIGGLMVIDPKEQSLISEYPFRSRTYESVVASSPVVAGEGVFITASYNTGTAFLRPTEERDYEPVWKKRRFGIEFANAIHRGGKMYMVDGKRGRFGAVLCLDLESGEELSRTDIDWDEEVTFKGESRGMNFSLGQSSLLYADGSFWCLTDRGAVLRMDCTPQGARVVAQFSPFHSSENWSPLVIHRGLLFVCQNQPEGDFGPAPKRLLCFDVRG